MTDIQLGRLLHVTTDHLVEKNEFAEIEKSIFAGDGFVSLLEFKVLYRLFDDQRMLIESDEDKKRLATILRGQALTLERYLEKLAEQNIAPRLPEKQIKAIENQNLKDRLPRLVRLDIDGDGNFSLTIKDNRGRLTWNYQTGDDPEITVHKTFAPLQFELIYLVMVQAYQKSISQKQRDRILTVIRTMIRLNREALKADPDLQKTRLNNGFAMSQDITEFGFLSYLMKNYPDTRGPGWEKGVVKLFKSQSDQKKTAHSLKDVLNKFPQGLKEIWQSLGTTVALVPHQKNQRAYLNTHTAKGGEQSHPETFGLTLSSHPWPILSAHEQGLESFSLKTAIHELGHNFYLYLDTLSGGEWSVQTQSPGKFHEFVSFIFALQNQKARQSSILENFPTLYSATNPLEYFAEYFAIYFLDKYAPQALPSGLVGLEQHLDGGYDFLLDELKEADPTGYSLMVALDQMLSQGTKLLEEFKTQPIRDVLIKNLPADRREDFRAQTADFENYAQNNGEFLQLATLPESFPLLQFLLDDLAQLTEMQHAALAQLEKMAARLEDNPLDYNALNTLSKLLSVENLDHPFWVPIKTRCGQIILKLHMSNPHVPQLFMLYVKSLMQRQKTAPAENLLHDYAKDNPDSLLVYEVNFLRTRCLIQMNKTQEASPILEQLVEELLSSESLLVQYPKDYPQLLEVLERSVAELVPLLRAQNREGDADNIQQNMENILTGLGIRNKKTEE